MSLLRVVTKASLPDTEAGLRGSANIYFTIAALVCASCVAVYGWVLPRLPAVQRHRRAALEAALAGAEVYHGGSTGTGGGGGAAPWKRQHDEQQQGGGARPGSVDLELSYEDHLQQEEQQQQQAGASGQQLRLQEEEAPSAQSCLLSSGPDALQNGSSGAMHGSGGARGGAALTVTAVFLLIWRLAVANALIYT